MKQFTSTSCVIFFLINILNTLIHGHPISQVLEESLCISKTDAVDYDLSLVINRYTKTMSPSFINSFFFLLSSRVLGMIWRAHRSRSRRVPGVMGWILSSSKEMKVDFWSNQVAKTGLKIFYFYSILWLLLKNVTISSLS